MRKFIRSITTLSIASIVAVSSVACNNNEIAYEPKPAYAGEKATLPAVPTIGKTPVKDGDAYTVWGASYYMRSRVHNRSVANQDIEIVGYIVKTNLPDAPKCAVHRMGREDPEDCRPPIPTFWIGDTKDAPLNESIKVMGWASNYAQIYDTIKELKRRARRRQKNKEPLTDARWGVQIPDPLPVKGAKVRVGGQFSTTFTKATSGAEADPIMGILTFDKIEYLEKADEVASLPGMR